MPDIIVQEEEDQESEEGGEDGGPFTLDIEAADKISTGAEITSATVLAGSTLPLLLTGDPNFLIK